MGHGVAVHIAVGEVDVVYLSIDASALKILDRHEGIANLDEERESSHQSRNEGGRLLAGGDDSDGFNQLGRSHEQFGRTERIAAPVLIRREPHPGVPRLP